MNHVKQIVLIVITLFAGATLQADSWNKNSLWKDKRAEVAFYDSEIVISSQPVKFREALIIAREDLNAETLVKADPAVKSKTVSVLKLNQVRQFQLENYPINFLTSVYVKQESPESLVKLIVASQDWTGNAFKIFKVKDLESPAGTLESYSHLGGNADSSVAMDVLIQDYFEEQLPMSLRSLEFKVGLSQKIRLWPSIAISVQAEPHSVDSILTVTAEETVYSHAGAIPCWKVSIVHAGKTDFYWFEKAMPHILIRMETTDGRKRLIYGRARWSFWDRRLSRPNILN